MSRRRRTGARKTAEFAERSSPTSDGRRDFLAAQEREFGERDADVGSAAGTNALANYHVREEFRAECRRGYGESLGENGPITQEENGGENCRRSWCVCSLLRGSVWLDAGQGPRPIRSWKWRGHRRTRMLGSGFLLIRGSPNISPST